MTSISPATVEALIVELIFVLLILRRQYVVYRGTAVSAGRIALGAAFILFLFALIELTGYYALAATFPGLGYAVLANVAIVAVGTLVFAGYAERRAHVWKAPNGIWMYQMGLAPALVYVGLFFARIGLEFAFFPSLLNLEPGVVLTQTTLLQLVVLETVAALLALSSGLLVGRGIGVYRRYQDLRATEAKGATQESLPSKDELP